MEQVLPRRGGFRTGVRADLGSAKSRHRPTTTFPTRAILVGIIVTMAVLSFGTWSTLVAHRQFQRFVSIELRLDRLGDRILHLDEVLTMSARMAALTDDPAWENRYRRFEGLLDEAIKETIDIAPDEKVRDAARQTDTANVALVAMENQAFALVRRRRPDAAIRLLNSPAYEEQKTLYARALGDNAAAIRRRVDQSVRDYEKRAEIELVLGGGAFVVLGIIWWTLIRLVRSNVAERATLVQQLRDAVQARDDFLSIASHELRSPLAALTLQMDSLSAARRRQRFENVPGLDRKLERVERQVTRLSLLTDTLLDISRIGSGRLSLQVEDGVDLAQMVRDLAVRFEPELQKASCTISVTGAEKPILGRWDPLRLEQVLGNLIANALKYGAGKPIEVAIVANPDVVSVTVRDHGVGIPADKQVRIFDRFERAVPERHYGGFGLGLWIAKTIVTAMHGEIAVQSQLGEGSTFQITLPRLDETQATPESAIS